MAPSGDAGGADGSVDGGGDDAAGNGPLCPPDANVTMLMPPDSGISGSGSTVAACYACIQNSCMSQLQDCNADCDCSGRISAYLSCLSRPQAMAQACEVAIAQLGDVTEIVLAACIGGSGTAGCAAPCGSRASVPDGGGD
jgi:hypothetical protein